MKGLIKFELKKIFQKRLTIIVLLGALVINLFNFFVNGVLQQMDVSPNGEEKRGLQAIAQRREQEQTFSGYLTEERLMEIVSHVNQIQNNPKNVQEDDIGTLRKKERMRQQGHSEEEIANIKPVSSIKTDVYWKEIHPYEPILNFIKPGYIPGIVNEFTEDDIIGIYDRKTYQNIEHTQIPSNLSMAQFEKLKSMYSEIQTPFYYNYYDGWRELNDDFSSFLVWGLGMVLIICLAPVFSEEYSYGTDAIILTTRYGKSKLTTAKIISSFLFVIGIFVAFALLNFALYGITYGFVGGECPIQLSVSNNTSPYNINFAQMFLLVLGLGIVGLLFQGAITLYISSKMKSPFLSIIFTVLLFFLPTINLPEKLLTIELYPSQKILYLFPVNIMNVPATVSEGVLYSFFGKVLTQPVTMVISAILLSMLLILLSCRAFRGHKV
ncbi:ABC transporter permease [Clostridium sp. MSJ-11]|uniref:ABC transporter permease n=1 Tax=Clostridium mobile TaxID=2841512 RepID=A0ABS6EMI3_9CLOT|nr:ABC transporter permease subunit [Clostridium mobile]MBU5485846.1 ABC transporter permease [Clostridium mobile]